MMCGLSTGYDLSTLGAAVRVYESLVLWGGAVLDDPSPISDMVELQNLQMEGWESIPRIADIPALPKLKSLGLGRLPIDTDLAPLEKFTHLDGLILQSSGQPRGLEVIGKMTSLTWLRLGRA